MKYNYLLKAIDQYLKCHQTIQNGWHDGIHFIKDNNNSQFERLINRDTFSENYKLNTKNGKIEEKDSEMMNNIQLEGFEKESYSDWIYPHYEDICQYQRYGTVDTDEDNLPDGYEVMICFTDPSSNDSDNNGIIDSEYFAMPEPMDMQIDYIHIFLKASDTNEAKTTKLYETLKITLIKDIRPTTNTETALIYVCISAVTSIMKR